MHTCGNESGIGGSSAGSDPTVGNEKCEVLSIHRRNISFEVREPTSPMSKIMKEDLMRIREK
jgi:hypothetical protein